MAVRFAAALTGPQVLVVLLALAAVLLTPSGGVAIATAHALPAPTAPHLRTRIASAALSFPSPSLSLVTPEPYVPLTVDLLDGSTSVGPYAGPDGGNPTDGLYDPANGLAYFGAQNGEDVAEVNASTATLIGFIPLSSGAATPPTQGLAPGPWALALDNSTGLLYVAHLTDFLSVINTTTNRLVQTVSLGEKISGLAVDETDRRLFATDSLPGTVDVMSTVNDTTIARIPGGPAMQRVAYDPQDGMVFVTAEGNSTVLEINATTTTLVRWIHMPFAPFGITYDGGTGQIAVAGCGSIYNVSTIDPGTGRILRNGTTGNCGTLITYLTGLHRLAVSNQYGVNYFVLNDTSLKLTNTVYAGASASFGFAFDPTAGLLYLAEQSWTRLGVFYTSNFSTPFHISMQDTATADVYLPVQNELAVLDYNQNQIYSYNLTSGSVTQNHTTGSQPYDMWYDPASGQIYETDTNGFHVYSSTSLSYVAGVAIAFYPDAATYDSTNGDMVAVGGTSIDQVDSANHTVIATATLHGSGGQEIVYDAQHNRVYVPDLGNNLLLSVNGTTLKTVNMTGVGASPDGVAYDPVDGTAWVVHQSATNVTVVNVTRSATVANLSLGPGGYSDYVLYDPALNAIVAITDNHTQNYRLFNASTMAPMGNYTFDYPMATSGLDGDVAYVPSARALAIADGSNVEFLERLPSTPTVTAAHAVPSQTSVGQPTNLSVSAGGGTRPLTFSYSGLPAGCVSGNSSVLSCVPSATGDYLITVNVTDGTGRSGTASFPLTVLPSLVASPLRVTPAAIFANRTILLATNVSGGVDGESFDWTGLPPGCSSLASSWIECSPNASGNYSVGVNITDSEGSTVSLGPVSLRVYAAAAINLAVNRSQLDLGQSVAFTLSATGGSGQFSYSWSGLPSGCSGGNFTTVTCTPTLAGVWNVTAEASDSSVGASISTGVAVEVNAPLAVVNLRASTTALTTGQTVQLSVLTVNGTLPYSYQWTGLPSGCSSVNRSVLNCTPDAAGNVSVAVRVTDAAGVDVDSPSVALSVALRLGSAGLVALPATTDLGGTFHLTASFVGGIAPFTFSWFGLPGGCASANQTTLYCTPDLSGSWSTLVQIADASGTVITSPSVSITVDAPLIADPPALSDSVREAGQSVVFTEISSGGSGSVAYNWSGLPSGCSSENLSSFSCQLVNASIGSWSVAVNLRDSAGFSAAAPAVSLVVVPALSATLNVNRVSLDTGQALMATIATSGGGNISRVVWQGLPPTCPAPGGNANLTVDCSLSQAGQSLIRAIVTDVNGVTIPSGTVTVTVYQAPVLNSAKASRTLLDVGEMTNLSVNIGYVGSGNDTVDWTGLPAGCGGQNVGPAALGCRPQAPGSFNASAVVVDSNGGRSGSVVLRLEVDTDPSIVSIVAQPNPITLGAQVSIFVNLTGGSGGLRTSWTGLPAGCVAPATGLTQLACTPLAVGSYDVQFNATDSNGVETSSPVLRVDVQAPTAPGTPAGSASPEWVLPVIGGSVILAVAAFAVVLARRRRAT